MFVDVGFENSNLCLWNVMRNAIDKKPSFYVLLIILLKIYFSPKPAILKKLMFVELMFFRFGLLY